MGSVTLEAGLDWAPRGRPVTVDDLMHIPDDGQLYELVDGVLVFVPPGSPRHSRIGSRLWQILDDAAPPELWAVAAPTGAIIDDHTWVEPDVFVAPRVELGGPTFRGVPLLAVEVLSPSNRLYDLTTKFSRYERAGVASYWVVDPTELRLVAWDLHDGRYVEVADVAADETWTASLPFEVTLRPGSLLD